MRRFSLRTLMIAFVLATAVIAICRSPIARFLNLHDTSSPLIEISTRSDLNDALASPNAIIFAHVDWAAHSVMARKTVTEFALQWRRNREAPHVDFYFLDLTDAQQNAPAHVSEWLTSDNRLEGLSFRGSGDVVWLKNGVFQKWIPACDTTVDELDAETKTLFTDI